MFPTERLAFSVPRCVGRNGPVICLAEAQYYNAPESRTIFVKFKEA